MDDRKVVNSLFYKNVVFPVKSDPKVITFLLLGRESDHLNGHMQLSKNSRLILTSQLNQTVSLL